MQHYTQPDYVLAHAGEMAQFEWVQISEVPPFGSSHGCRKYLGAKGRLKNYQHMRQKFLLTLPLGLKAANTTTFDALAAECVKPKTKRSPGKDWISERNWKLIAKRASLLRSGKLRQAAAWRMKCKIQAAIKADKSRLTTDMGESIMSELSKGNVQEAFRHLRGWYRTALETQARPCRQMMERQTNKQVELYAERAAQGAGFPANGTPFTIADVPPSDGGLPAEPRPMLGRIRDSRGTHQGVAPRSKEGRGSREWRKSHRRWEIVE